MSAAPVVLSSAHFALLQRVIRSVSRSNRLSVEDAEDFGQTVHLRLLERNYDVFDSYEGRSSLQTYLTVVVTRLLLDWRNATRGKWRPAAATVRLGADAIALERLIHRDGLTRDEAIATLASKAAAAAAGDEASESARLADIADRMPARVRRTFVRDLTDDALGSRDFEDPIEATEEQARQRAVRRALRSACARLDERTRHIVDLRYRQGCTVRRIGDVLRTDPKPLYRQLERAVDTLRHSLHEMGVQAPDSLSSVS